MTNMKKIIITLLTALILFAIYWQALFHSNHNEMASALIGEDVPAFTLTDINSNSSFQSNDLATGKIVLLNVWATWCYACEVEADMLMKIKNTYHIPIFGVAYKDDPTDAREWLKKHGNPYTKIGDDKYGDTAIDLGVYGTPETFVISPQGKIIYRHIGVIDQRVWDEVLYPLVKKYEK